ncbi:hypothetical protein BST13_35770 [Mycobacterium aquaticum]|uniref:HTH tetR-type domain-containing protein n=2 Tax=Mycobacterium aquaticum TaxID=1927124 RepID=A0A1W9ZYK2_9MYCO|nr:hypothetical protein BST13_35770 [Mycobacterium aquaticum]
MRTSGAILNAAIVVLGQRPSAPLRDIAAAAGVSCTTLHRYFAERSDLIRAMALHLRRVSLDGIRLADPDHGLPLDAFRRVVETQLDLGPAMLYIYTEPVVRESASLLAHIDSCDGPVAAALNKVAPRHATVPAGWVRRVFWSLLCVGCRAIQTDGIPRQLIVDVIVDTLIHGLVSGPGYVQLSRLSQPTSNAH